MIVVVRKWNWQSDFKPWIELFAFYFMLMPWRKACIHLFSLAMGKYYSRLCHLALV